MANCFLGYPNYLEATAYPVRIWGEGWNRKLPLAYLREQRLVRRARSINCDPKTTRFRVDLGIARGIRMVAIPLSNGSLDCTFRAVGYQTDSFSGTPEADTGVKELFPVIYPQGTSYFGTPQWWDGKLSPEERENYPMPWVHVFPNTVVARYWEFFANDPGNENGFIELARVFLSPGWQPTINAAYGSTIGWMDRSRVVESWGGGLFFDQKKKRRFTQLNFDGLPLNEAMVNPFEIGLRLGISGQAFLVTDPDDTVNMHRRAFLGRFAETPIIDYVMNDINATSVRFEEVIA